ncbi:MAG: hypothetical protein J4431_00815 [Candidatus Aenigmarchaeota archaeon]|nr:hypothetical protein [Candidatus Aenigmarchaeota archaeon]
MNCMKAQSTCESCLPVCLMELLRMRGVRVKDSEETKILMEGLTFTKLDYTIGQLIYVAKKYGVGIEQYTDFPSFNDELLRLDIPKSIKLLPAKNSKRLVMRLAAKAPIAVYMDKYDLDGIYHYSHFILLLKMDKQTSTFFDPWDGKIKKMMANALMSSVRSLRNRLGISPKLIRMI